MLSERLEGVSLQRRKRYSNLVDYFEQQSIRLRINKYSPICCLDSSVWSNLRNIYYPYENLALFFAIKPKWKKQILAYADWLLHNSLE